MSDKKIRVGVIGAGSIARSVHLPSLADIDGCEPIWICDLREDRAKAQAERFGIPKYGTNYVSLLENDRPDAVFVLVQPDQLFRIALDSIRAGCHVFMEKPMGITLYQAETLLRESEKAGVQCQVGFNRRFVPLVQEVVARMKALGPIHQIDGWFYKNSSAAFYDGCSSAYTCDMVHTVDLIRHIAGAPARQAVKLTARYGDSPVDNAWNALIAFENGISATAHANYATGGRVHGFAIHGAAASAYIDLGFGTEACSAKILYCVNGTFSMASGGAGEQNIELLDGKQIAESERYYRYYGYYSEDKMFIEALLEGKRVPCDAQDAVETMRLMEQIKTL